MPFVESPELKALRERYNIALRGLRDSGSHKFTVSELAQIIDCIKREEIERGEWEHETKEELASCEKYVAKIEAMVRR